jgi:biotin carboxyl carrier protein
LLLVPALVAGLAACGSSSSTQATVAPVVTVAAATSTTAAAVTGPPASSASSTSAAATSTTGAPGTGAPASPAAATGTTTPPVTAPNDATVISVTVGTDDAVTLGQRVERVHRNQQMKITLVSPQAEAYHLHGYDLESPKLAAGKPFTFDFKATQTGTFEIESHVTDKVLLVLEVSA